MSRYAAKEEGRDLRYLDAAAVVACDWPVPGRESGIGGPLSGGPVRGGPCGGPLGGGGAAAVGICWAGNEA